MKKGTKKDKTQHDTMQIEIYVKVPIFFCMRHRTIISRSQVHLQIEDFLSLLTLDNARRLKNT